MFPLWNNKVLLSLIYWSACALLSFIIIFACSSHHSFSFLHLYHLYHHLYHHYHPYYPYYSYHPYDHHRLHHLIFFPNRFTVDDFVFLHMNHMIYSIASHTLLLWSALISKFHSLFLFQFFLSFILRWFIRSHEAHSICYCFVDAHC